MNNIKIAAAVILATLSLYACRKGDDAPPAATLILTSPVLSQNYKTGDVIHITGTAAYVANLHGYHTCILNAHGDTLFEADNHIHAAQITIDESWVDTVANSQQLKVLVSSQINHDGDEVKKEVIVTTVP